MDEAERDDPAGVPASDADDAVRPTPLLAACVIIALQTLALLAAAGIVLIKAATQTSASLTNAVLVGLFALAGALVLVLCARSLLRLSPAARMPVVVIELLAVPVAYSLAFEANRVAYGAPILLSALAVLYLLFTPPVRAVLDREAPSS